MILYHGTDIKNLESILKFGLLPKHQIWCSYLSSEIETCKHYGNLILEIDVSNLNLTAFPEYLENGEEVLCWDKILPNRIISFKTYD